MEKQLEGHRKSEFPGNMYSINGIFTDRPAIMSRVYFVPWGGVRLSTSVTNYSIVLFGGMGTCRGNRSSRKQPLPIPISPAQILYDVGTNQGRGRKSHEL
jgi:hypothetical protein